VSSPFELEKDPDKQLLMLIEVDCIAAIHTEALEVAGKGRVGFTRRR